MQSGENTYKIMTEAPVGRVIVRMAVPTVISMLVACLYNIVDTWFVGRLDTCSIAAVGIVFSVMCVLQAIGSFFGHGSGAYMARELGACRHDNVRRMASTAFVLSFVVGLALAVVVYAFIDRLSLWLGSTLSVLPYTRRYLSILLFGMPFFISSFTLSVQLRMQGLARLSMYGITSGVILNIILDPLLIFGCDMQLRGAAWATVIGQWVSFVVLYVMSRRYGVVHLRLRDCAFGAGLMREIACGGSPSLSRQGLGSVSMILLNLSAGVYGDAAIAAMSIVNRITMFVMSVIIGLGQGFQPMCGYCYGARLYARLRRGFWFTVRLGTLVLVVFSSLLFLSSHEVIALFHDEEDVVAIGGAALRWQLAANPLNAYVMAGNMMLQTIRKPIRANILSSSRKGLLFIPLIIILPHFFGLRGVEMCQACCDVLTFIMAVPMVGGVLKAMKKIE